MGLCSNPKPLIRVGCLCRGEFGSSLNVRSRVGSLSFGSRVEVKYQSKCLVLDPESIIKVKCRGRILIWKSGPMSGVKLGPNSSFEIESRFGFRVPSQGSTVTT